MCTKWSALRTHATRPPMSVRPLPIHECFHTFQGEGNHAGKPAFFIRTFGCPLHCPWCDSAGTWHKDYVPSNIKRMSVAELVRAATHTRAGITVITGGEPAIHNLTPLTEALQDHGIRVHVETSGAFEIPAPVNWITLSPKIAQLPVPSVIKKAHEMKWIIDTVESVDFWRDWYSNCLQKMNVPAESIWLHPEWSQRNNPAILNAISEAVKQGGGLYRAGWQMHKLYRVDSLDKRTQPLAPLGGDPSKGY